MEIDRYKPKRPLSAGAIVAIASAVLLGGGMFASRWIPSEASSEETPTLFYWAGVAVATVFIAWYVLTMGVPDPCTKGPRKPTDER